jgi:DNA-binding SARP family transcriptional activator
MEKKDFNGAISYLQTYLQRDPNNAPAQTNLLLLYLDTHQPEKAKTQVKRMQQLGIAVPQQVVQQLGM